MSVASQDSGYSSSISAGSIASSHSSDEECSQVKVRVLTYFMALSFKMQPSQSGNFKCDHDVYPAKTVWMNLIQTSGEKISLTDDNCRDVKIDSELFQWEMMEALHVFIDTAVFGTLTKNLQPTEEKPKVITDKAEEMTLLAMNYCGLPVNEKGELDEEKASLHPDSETVVFGWKEFPMRFLQKTLKNWREGDYEVLDSILITRRYPTTDRKKLISENLDFLIPVWKLSEHKSSVFTEQNIDDYKKRCNGKDLVEMYVLFSNVDDTMAVVSVSDYAISIQIGHSDFEEKEFPAMKTAFSEVTRTNIYYQIKGPKLKVLKERKEV